MPPKKKKLAHQQTTDELMKRAFPKEVHEHLKRLAHGDPKKPAKRP